MNRVNRENPLLWDVLQLASNLRQERLFVHSEQALLQELNEKVMTASSKLGEVAWITSQQRLNLNKLIVSRPDTTPAMCSKKANSLNSAKFVSAQNVLGYQKCASYGEVLDSLRGSPELIARCLVVGDSCLNEEMPSIVHSLVTGLYASCVLPADKNVVLEILGHLISFQLTRSDTPRRLLRPGSCAFSCLYSAFHESLFSAKLYLTAALHSPIMQLLMMEEKYLDIDPEKVAIRLEERAKLMGGDSDDQYNLDIDTHRASTVKILASVAKAFISSLQDNLHCFPRSVCWLVNRIYLQLTKANSLPEKEVFAMCTDLVLTLFICPAIVKPEPYGITDVPISAVARFNLIQVAQIIQMLALRKFEPIDPKLDDLYSHFDKDSVSSIIETMIDPNFIIDDPVVDVESGKFEHVTRTTSLFTEQELNSLVAFLRTVSNTNSGDAKLQKELPSLLNQLPSPVVNGHPKPNLPSPEISTKKSKILKGSKFKHQNGSCLGPEVASPDEDEYGPTVLVIPFDINNDSSLGLDSEQKILAMEKEVDGDRLGKGLKTEKSDRAEGQEKRTRFSLSHDDGSIGNTSDNLEVVSEAPSNHSVASSLELETEDQNDNLSDMISANVSGRGSPSISGRDTPSSQITEGDESAAGGSSVRQQLDFTPSRPAKIAPQPRFDLDEKFGKFEIKTLMEGADETISLVSDTWSTDVLASDSEILEQQIPPMLPPPLLPERIISIIAPPQLDITETASEAWSTDVMASDSERMTEVDTDDTASVARSDDTGRSEIESRGEPEATEEVVSPLLPGIGGSVASAAASSGGLFSPATVQPPSTPSPARHSETVNPVSTSNVTGRGGARSDYRRRTLEYLDSNRNIYSKLCYSDEESAIADKESAKVASGVAAAVNIASIVTPVISSTSSVVPSVAGQELEDYRAERDSTCAPPSYVSASSSSSGSSDGAANQSSDIPTASLIVPNGPVVMQQDIIDSPKPSSAPGAIPKSISFDKTAERGDKESLDEDGKPKKSFFRFKLPFKNRRGKSFRLDGFDQPTSTAGDSSFPLPPARLRRGVSADEASNRPTSSSSSSLAAASTLSARLDTTDDILAKYRGQKPTTSVVSSGPPSESAGSSEKPPSDKGYDLFEDARKKLRLALSTSEVQQLPDALHLRETWNRKENDLITFLRLQLAEAINLQDSCLTPQLYETLRCVKMLSDEECQKLFESLKEDYKNRKPYISYLIKCRKGLLSTLAHIDRLKERVKRDRTVVLEFLSSMCVRMFLERRDQQLTKFSADFQALSLADEKSDLLDTFLERFFMEMTKDPVWQSASEDQLEQARVSVERSLFSRVYLPAMYPNGDGDIARDQVLSDHVSKLGKVISPEHKDLRIPQMFLCECPWLSAQAEMSQMAAYRSPRDKLHCVLRSITTIMNLLSLTCVPAADDLMPVLVYVIIMANPPSMLSTIEYVTSFYGNRLEGEEQYYWTQFCSAIEFIKTMDYLVTE